MNRVASLVITFGIILIIFIGCGEKKTKEQLNAEALRYEREENYKEAIKTFELLADKYPQANFADSVLFRIAQIYSNNLSDFEGSIATHKRLIEKYPESNFGLQSLFLVGFHYNNNIKDTVNARLYYEKFLEKYPNHELVTSVEWELQHLGKDPNEIEFLKTESPDEANSQQSSSDAKAKK